MVGCCLACSSSSGTSSDGGADGRADAAVVTAYDGIIDMTQGIDSQGSSTAGVHNGGAMFISAISDTGIQNGPCKLYPTYAQMPTFLDAGRVAFAGLVAIDLERLSASSNPPGTGEYIVPVGSGRFTAAWTAGQLLTVKVEGTSAVPAVELTVAGPTQVTITSPEIYPYIKIARAQDLSLTWTGGSANASVVLSIATTGPTGNPTDTSPRLVCQWDSTAGKGTIPASALGALPAGEAMVRGFNQAQVEQVKGDWRFTFAASFSALATCTSACGGTIREAFAAVTLQ